VIVLACLIQSSDALFEGEETLVDFCSILLSLFASVYNIGTSLTTCQINETHLTKVLAAVLNLETEDGV
jgi:hypothetical protein